MLRGLTPRQYDEWCEFYRLEPWGAKGSDIRAWKLAAAVAPPERELDSELFVGDPPEPEQQSAGMDPERLKAALYDLAARQNRIHRQNKK